MLDALPVIGPIFKIYIEKYYDNSYENIGRANSWVWYGPRWAQAATAPSRMNKGYITQGGIRCPAIIRYPPIFPQNQISHEFTTVMDIYPTILSLAGIPLPPGQFQGRQVVPVRGQSWTDFFQGRKERVYGEQSFTGWELFGRLGVRKGKWKATFIPEPHGPGVWELFDLDDDPGETKDLSKQEKVIFKELLIEWDRYVSETGVVGIPPEYGTLRVD